MWIKTAFILFLVLILTSDFAFAQEPQSVKDSISLYENIEAYAGHSRFTKFMYRLFFKPIVPVYTKKGAKIKLSKRLVQKPYSSFEGKTIRHIHIITLEPFGNSIGDTIEAHLNFISRAGNKLHMKSRPVTLRNLLLIRENQPFDSLLVKESERLVRSRGFVTDVSFFVKAAARNSDSVDIYIRELDSWSIIPGFVANGSRVTVNMTDKNFAGLGHEFQNGLTWHKDTRGTAYRTNYFIPNIRNTYINSTFHFGTDEFSNFTRSFAIDRPFFSPYAKWAAGVIFSQQHQQVYADTSGSGGATERFKFSAQDYWAGHAIQLFKGSTENNRTTHFISALRFLRIRYPEKPAEPSDAEYLYANEDFFLTSIGISRRKYVQDKYVFKYGVTEDIPIGRVFSLTGGYQVKNNRERVYLGARIASGNYYPWGYLGTNYEFGTFILDSQAQQGVFSASIIYFTGLREIGKWKFRQFVKPQVTYGINRFLTDSLTLNDESGLRGFYSPALSGNSRLLLTLQTQSYSPWNFIGFRFGPYLVCSLGMLGDAETGLKNSKVYSQIGVGVLIKNINLVINTFQVSIAFYPSIPGEGRDIFKFNSFGTADLGFRDFDIGKPATIVFQ